MGGAASKAKGSGFERRICKALSLWVTDGVREDVFWRSSMSGGRATVAKGKVRQAGDICAVAPEGHALVDQFFIECKSYRSLGIGQFLICGAGPLAKFWKVACREAEKYERAPMLIAKQNGLPALVLLDGAKGLQPFTDSVRQWWHEDVVVFKLDDMLEIRYDAGFNKIRCRF